MRVLPQIYALRSDGVRNRVAWFIATSSQIWSGDRLKSVSELMQQRHLKNIPAVDADNRPVGVLTARIILRALLGDAEYEEAQLIDFVKGVGYR